MWKSLLVIAVAAAVARFELPELRRRRDKSAAVYVGLLVVGTVAGITAVQQMELPSPLHALAFVFKPLHEWLGQIVG